MIQKAETGFFGFARPNNLPRSLLKYLSDFTPRYATGGFARPVDFFRSGIKITHSLLHHREVARAATMLTTRTGLLPKPFV
jgi:hypothetical protein